MNRVSIKMIETNRIRNSGHKQKIQALKKLTRRKAIKLNNVRDK